MLVKRLLLGLLTCVIAVSFSASVMADDPTVGAINPATSIIGQAEGDRIGDKLYVLPSGNLVINSNDWGDGRGATACITPEEYKTGGIQVDETNSLVGSITNQANGVYITVLATGDYVVFSPFWDNGATTDVGAVTWVDGDTCIPFGETSRAAEVSPSNSLIGTSTNDRVGGGGIRALPNGNYVVNSPIWKNTGLQVGASTWCRGTSPCVGTVSATNSLIGESHLDNVASYPTIVLSDGDYIVSSPSWNASRGAVTWCSATAPCLGVVNATTSLVGVTPANQVGAIIPLTNGNYVVDSSKWNDGVNPDYGAVTWCSGTGGCKGVVSAANSLIGGLIASDTSVPIRAYTLPNGNYLVRNDLWDDGATTNAGALTWCSGNSGCTGTISAANSIIGTSVNETVGSNFAPFPNGGYAVGNERWNDYRGAVRICNGIAPCVGAMTAGNSIVGSKDSDSVGSRIKVLSNGNLVIGSPNWTNPDGDVFGVGAVTLIDPSVTVTGVVSAANSLIGSSMNDNIGYTISALDNGHYVIASPNWNNGATQDVGIVTWRNGTAPTIGVVSPANSLIGGQANDRVGFQIMTQKFGQYSVVSRYWNGNLGALTVCDGSEPCLGTVSAANSWVGNTVGDFDEVQFYFDPSLMPSLVPSLPNGNFLARLINWDSPNEVDAGAILIGNAENFGTVNATTAVVGDKTDDLRWNSTVLALPNGDVILHASTWDNGAIANAGAIRRLSGSGSSVGEINETNALVGLSTAELAIVNLVIRPDNSFFIAIPNWDNNRGIVIYSPGPENLLANPSFETAGSPAKYAAQWKSNTASYTAADKRLCNKPAKPLTRTDGSCLFQFNSTNTPAKTRTLKQTINNPVWGTTGNILTLTADVEGLKVGGGAKKIILNIKYNNNTTDKATLTIPAGTYDYTTLLGTVELTRPVKTVTITINVGKATGRIRIDNLFLSVSAAPVLRFPSLGENTTRDGASTFDAPAAPEGFRH